MGESVGYARLRERAAARRLLNRFTAAVSLGRGPETCVVFAASLVGARLAALAVVPPLAIAAVAASNALLFAASVIFNDWHDLTEDAINKPRRPLVAGTVTHACALRVSVALVPAAVALAAVAGPSFAAMAALIAGLSALYTLKLKGVPFLGNLLVAAVSTYALGCWMLLVSPTATYLVLTLACLAVRVGSEIVKTAEDAAGDAARGLRTVATTRGIASANRIGLAFLSLGLALCAIPVLRHDTNVMYHAMLLLSMLLAGSAWLGGTTLRGHLVAVERAVMVLMIIGIGIGIGSPATP